jgi:D-alanyl-lipoteichoic acid acyltransferase DltB (MBOAT superfamily)
MNLASLEFLVALLLLSVVFFYLPGRHWRQGLLATCNAGFLYLLVPNVESWVALGLFLASGYAVSWLLRRWPSHVLFTVYLIALVAAFLVIRKYDLVTATLPESLVLRAVSIVGLSYMLFRQIHFLVDTFQGQIERTSLWAYANYQLNLFTLLSGPIQRYQDFHDHWETLTPTFADGYIVQRAYFRLLMGIIKMTVVATIFMSLYQRSADALTHAANGASGLGRTAAIGNFLGVLYFYPIYLYLNFSAYCDIVIAGASLFGMKLPENFNQPYLARNVLDFWTRFHRTLGFWIRDYLFLPLYKFVAETWPKRADSLAFLCYFMAFFVAGVWHGPTANFVVFGLLQAVGASAAKLWERHVLKRHGRKGLKQYLDSSRTRAIAIVGTLHFQFVSILFFPVDVRTTVEMFRTVLRAVL